MTKAFVVLNSTHQPVNVFLIPELHTTSHHISQLHKAAESKGRYGMLVDAKECGAPEVVDFLKALPQEDLTP